MNAPVLLCFNVSPVVQGKLRWICARFGVRLQGVAPEELGQPLAALCGYAPREAQPEPAAPFDEALLVMALFPPGLVQQFLLALKRAKLPPFPLKAVLTAHNRAWTPGELYRELCREREAIAQGRPRAHEEDDGGA